MRRYSRKLSNPCRRHATRACSALGLLCHDHRLVVICAPRPRRHTCTPPRSWSIDHPPFTMSTYWPDWRQSEIQVSSSRSAYRPRSNASTPEFSGSAGTATGSPSGRCRCRPSGHCSPIEAPETLLSEQSRTHAATPPSSTAAFVASVASVDPVFHSLASTSVSRRTATPPRLQQRFLRFAGRSRGSTSPRSRDWVVPRNQVAEYPSAPIEAVPRAADRFWIPPWR